MRPVPGAQIATRLMSFCDKYSRHFIAQGRNSVEHARHYISGLMGTQRKKNIETIENDVSQSNYQGMEQFISSSPWQHRALMDDVAKEASEALGDELETGLMIDETSFLKKGKASVGVQRQWSGRAGKVENCQVGVFASLVKQQEFALIDFELYLPQSWADDPDRCDKAKIPIDQREYKPKWQQALSMVRRARQNGVKFGWIGADALYGNNQEFTDALEDDGEFFMADIHSNHKVWLSEPELIETAAEREATGEITGKQDRPATGLKLSSEMDKSQYQRVDKIVAERFRESASEVNFRQGAKGKMSGRFMKLKVWTWHKDKQQRARERTLIVREDEGGEMKYSLTNLPENTDLKRHAYVQNQRYWIEHAFHEAKSELGMSQYQVRVWQGWHHHMALVCLSTLFMAKEKQLCKETLPLLSYRDVVELLDYYLPRRSRDESEVHAQIRKRHKARQQDIDRRRNKTTGIAARIEI